MKKIKHTAFYIAYNGDKDWLITQMKEGALFNFFIHLKDLRGEIFSNSTLKHFIDEEIRHDHFEIEAGNNHTLNSSSSGEQRKALLAYIISKKPGYVIIDNVFESLDLNSRQSILLALMQLSGETLLLQIFNRKADLLPFIETIYCVEERSVTAIQNRDEFLSEQNTKGKDIFMVSIPPPLNKYEPQNGPLVKMKNVSVEFNGRPVLQNICWQIDAGEFWQLTGPNGSGKSTLLSLITGNSPKGYGQDLYLFGRRKGTGETVWEVKNRIGYFTPSMTLNFERQDSIEQMILSGFFDSVGLYTKPSDRQILLARDWLTLIGLYKNRDQPFHKFPEEHQRMVLIARAMVKHPPLLILDEPTAGLDDEMAVLFTILINKIATETTTSILYVSHREEPGLSPDRIFELSPTEKGSAGNIKR